MHKLWFGPIGKDRFLTIDMYIAVYDGKGIPWDAYGTLYIIGFLVDGLAYPFLSFKKLIDRIGRPAKNYNIVPFYFLESRKSHIGKLQFVPYRRFIGSGIHDGYIGACL